MQRCRPARAVLGGPLGVGDQRVDRVGQPRLEGLGVAGVVVHQQPGLAVGDDLGNAADVGGDHRRRTRHRLEVHDAQRLVDRRADENRCRRENFADLVGRQHLRTQNTPVARPATAPRTAPPTSAAISGVSGAPAHSTSCTSGANRCAAATRCATPFCRVIRPTNATIGRRRVDAEFGEHRLARPRPSSGTRRRCRCRCAPRAPGRDPAPDRCAARRRACRS